MKVFLVIDKQRRSTIYGVFADEDAALDYARHLAESPWLHAAHVITRELHYGQQIPSNMLGILP